MPYERRREKEEEQEEGVPAWMLTFGDINSLLLVFFILIVSMSTVNNDRFAKVLGQIAHAFGFGVSDIIPREIERQPAEIYRDIIKASTDPTKRWGALLENINGYEATVTTVKEGLKITLGGHALFDPGSAALKSEALPILIKVGTMLYGYRNRIEIRGHTDSKPLPPGSPFQGADNPRWRLSFERGLAISAFLITQQRLEPELLRIAGCAQYDPAGGNLKEAVMSERTAGEGGAIDRRGEIIVSEEMVPYPGYHTLPPRQAAP